MDNRLAIIEEIAADINKKTGEQLLIKGSDARLDVPHTTTGVLAFDLALGGGWATNQWNEIIGEESSGKTAIAYKTIAANQALDPDWLALWVAAEEYVPDYAASFGVDLERLWVIETNAMESALELVLKAVDNRAVDCVVIDSLPALVTETEVNKAMDEASVATGAQILSRFFKKCAKAQRRSMLEAERPCTLIAINQWRDRIGVLYGDPRTTPGGKAKNYYYFTRVEVRRDEWISEGSRLDTRVGQTLKMRVIKNKTYRPQQIAQADFYFADSGPFRKGEFDTVKDVVNVCLSLETVFEGRYKFEGERIAARKDELYEAVRNDSDLQHRLRQVAMDTVLDNRRSEALDSEVLGPQDREPDDVGVAV